MMIMLPWLVHASAYALVIFGFNAGETNKCFISVGTYGLYLHACKNNDQRTNLISIKFYHKFSFENKKQYFILSVIIKVYETFKIYIANIFTIHFVTGKVNFLD